MRPSRLIFLTSTAAISALIGGAFTVAAVQRGIVWSREGGVAFYLLEGLTWFLSTASAVSACALTQGVVASVRARAGAPGGRTTRLFVSAVAATTMATVTGILIAAFALWAVNLFTVGAGVPSAHLLLLMHTVCAVEAAAAVGAAVGTVWPHRLAPAVSGAAIFITAMVPIGGLSDFFAPTASSVTLIGTTPNLEKIGWHVLIAVLISAACWLVLLTADASQLRQRSRAAVAVVSAAVVGLGAVSTMRSASATEQFDAVPHPLVGACASEQGFEFCTASGSGYEPSPSLRAMLPYLVQMEHAGLRPIARYRQVGGSTTSTPPNIGAVVTAGLPSTGPAVSVSDFLPSLVNPSLCADFRAYSPPNDALAAAFALSAWLQLRAVKSMPSGLSKREQEWLSQPESDEWAKQTYPRLSSCSLSGIKPPAAFTPNG